MSSNPSTPTTTTHRSAIHTAVEAAQGRLVLEMTDGTVWACHDGAVIGRKGDVATERFANNRVLSRQHLKVEQNGEAWSVTRLPDARNRTWIDGAELNPGESRALSSAHVIQVADFQFRLVVDRGPKEGDAGLLELVGALRDCPTPILVLDDELRCGWMSHEAEEFLGTNLKAARDFVELIRTENRSEFRRELQELQQSSASREIELFLSNGVTPRVRFHFRFPYYLGVGIRQAGAGGENAETARQMAFQTKTLAFFSHSAAFQEGDVAKSFALVTVNSCEALNGSRVRIWLSEENGGDRLICRGDYSVQGGAQKGGAEVKRAYCPAFFERLDASPHLAAEDDSQPAFAILREVGFASTDANSLLCAEIRLGERSYGVVSFERSSSGANWAKHEEHFAMCVANFCLLVLQANERRNALQNLREKEKLLGEGMANARRYVEQILPPPLDHPDVRAEWAFDPCDDLGGDTLGYHWIDDDHLAMYVIDVVGHGTGAALLAVSVVNAIRAQLLPTGDFRDPAAVLSAVNRSFQMEEQNMMTFTMWYGVFHRLKRAITYSSAGHPPALLLLPRGEGGEAEYRELSAEGLIVGGLEDAAYESQRTEIGDGAAKLYVFSDGVFELPLADERMWTFEEFTAAVRFTQSMENGETGYLLERARSLCAAERLPDDYAMLRFTFNPKPGNGAA